MYNYIAKSSEDLVYIATVPRQSPRFKLSLLPREQFCEHITGREIYASATEAVERLLVRVVWSSTLNVVNAQSGELWLP